MHYRRRIFIHFHVFGKTTLFVFTFINALFAEVFGNGVRVPSAKLIFPTTSTTGLLLVIAIPLQGNTRSAYMAYNFEANFALPNDDQTFYEYPPIIGRDTSRFATIDRKLVYTGIETKLETLGYNGKPCLLRIICESAAITMHEVNGVLGDILHIVFTPSTSTNDGLDKAYQKAENVGTYQKNCTKYHKKCSSSFLGFISWIGHAI